MELILLIGITLLGAILASFVGVLVERINTGASWANDRSRCDACATPLTARDLIPVLSWLVSRGACRTCGSRVPIRHLLVESLTALTFALSYLSFGLSLIFLLYAAALLVLLFIVLYDLRHTIVPMRAVLAFCALALLVRFLLAPEAVAFGLALLVAGCAASVFLLFHVLSRGRAMGLGDTPVVLGLSLLTGPAVVLPGILFSFWIGALYGITVLVGAKAGHRMGIEVPFVPFLALGFLLAYFTAWNPLPIF